MRGYSKGVTVQTEIRHIREAVVRAFSAIRAAPDAEQAFADATEMGRLGEELKAEAGEFRAWLAAQLFDSDKITLRELAKVLGLSKSRIDQLVTAGRTKGSVVMDPGTEPEPLPIAAAIITTDLGVLIERRHDERPPWTFPAAEIQYGESPADALRRRVPEETGVQVTSTEVIGRRIHPLTGRVMIYLRAQVDRTDIVPGAPEDLAEVRWAATSDMRTLMPDMFPPVRALLDEAAA